MYSLMPSLTSKQIKELTKLAVLTLLAEEPLYQESGAGPQAIERDISLKYDDLEMFSSVAYFLVPEMVKDGLIRREEIAGKPHFITDYGREYLESARRKALFPELEQRKDWSKRETDPALQEEIEGMIRGLPEFRKSGDQRIQQVSQQLVEIIGRSSAR
jgi:hypothetical protein